MCWIYVSALVCLGIAHIIGFVYNRLGTTSGPTYHFLYCMKHMLSQVNAKGQTPSFGMSFTFGLSHQSSAATTAVLYSPSPTIYSDPGTLFQLRDSDEGAIGCELAPLCGENEY